jgi:hypothetical protein
MAVNILRSQTSSAEFDNAKFYVSAEACRPLMCADRFLIGTSLLRNAVAQLDEALRYKSEGRGFDSLWCQWNFSLTWGPWG